MNIPVQTGSTAAAVEHLAYLFTQGDLAAMAHDAQQPSETAPA